MFVAGEDPDFASARTIHFEHLDANDLIYSSGKNSVLDAELVQELTKTNFHHAGPKLFYP